MTCGIRSTTRSFEVNILGHKWYFLRNIDLLLLFYNCVLPFTIIFYIYYQFCCYFLSTPDLMCPKRSMYSPVSIPLHAPHRILSLFVSVDRILSLRRTITVTVRVHRSKDFLFLGVPVTVKVHTVHRPNKKLNEILYQKRLPYGNCFTWYYRGR